MRFWLAKLRNNEAYLTRHACRIDELSAQLKGKRVAIIGNARALGRVGADKGYGASIDACDIVIRLNSAPMPSFESHGRKTTMIAMSTPVAQSVLDQRGPDIVLWMTPKRKRLPRRLIALGDQFFLYPAARNTALAHRLGGRPTTGAMVIDLVSQSDAGKIELFGFDFFSSLSLSGRREAREVKHDFDAEAQYVSELVKTDPRITLHPME